MSDIPIYQQGRKDDTSRQGPPQYTHAVPSPSQDQPMIIAQAGRVPMKHPDHIQQKAALIQAAARMAEDAASAAEKAANMARQAAEMVSQAVNLPLEGQSSTAAAPLFLSNALGETISDSTFFSPVRPQQQQQIGQPIESYQSQFSAASEGGPKRKRKARASSRQVAGGGDAGDSIAVQAVPSDVPNYAPDQGSATSHRLADYELQLKLLEEANRKREETERQKRMLHLLEQANRKREKTESQERMLQLPHSEHESGGSGM